MSRPLLSGPIYVLRTDYAWNESQHPRGQPENAGEFVDANGTLKENTGQSSQPSPHDAKKTERMAYLSRVYGAGKYRDGFAGDDDPKQNEVAKIAFEIVRGNTSSSKEIGPVYNAEHKMTQLWSGTDSSKFSIVRDKKRGQDGFELSSGASSTFISESASHDQIAWAVHKVFRSKPPKELKDKMKPPKEKRVDFANETSDLIVQQSLDKLAKKPGDKKAANKLSNEVKRRIAMKRVRIGADGMLAMDDGEETLNYNDATEDEGRKRGEAFARAWQDRQDVAK